MLEGLCKPLWRLLKYLQPRTLLNLLRVPTQAPTTSMVSAIDIDDISKLRSGLEDQDRPLLSACAQRGTPETAHYLLSRLPPSLGTRSDDGAGHLASTPETTYLGTHIANASPTHHALLYLLHQSARCGNFAVFRSLAAAHPIFLTTKNRNIEKLLVNAIEGGSRIWEVILSHNPRYVDHEFSGHKGCLLEIVVKLGGLSACCQGITTEQSKKKAWEILKYLLQQGADTERAGDPVQELLKVMKAEKRVIEEVGRWSAKNWANGMW